MKKTRQEGSRDERLRYRKEWWNLRYFSCNVMLHLCVQKVIYSEWSGGRRDLVGSQYHQVGEMACGVGNGPFDVLCPDVYRVQFEKACIFSNRGRWNHTHSHTNTFVQRGVLQRCDNSQFSWHLCAFPHKVKLTICICLNFAHWSEHAYQIHTPIT